MVYYTFATQSWVIRWLIHHVKFSNGVNNQYSCCSISFKPGQCVPALSPLNSKSDLAGMRSCYNEETFFDQHRVALRVNKSGDARKILRSPQCLEGFIAKICISTRSNLSASESRWCHDNNNSDVMTTSQTWQSSSGGLQKTRADFSQFVESPLIFSRQSDLTLKVAWVSSWLLRRVVWQSFKFLLIGKYNGAFLFFVVWDFIHVVEMWEIDYAKQSRHGFVVLWIFFPPSNSWHMLVSFGPKLSFRHEHL